MSVDGSTRRAEAVSESWGGRSLSGCGRCCGGAAIRSAGQFLELTNDSGAGSSWWRSVPGFAPGKRRRQFGVF